MKTSIFSFIRVQGIAKQFLVRFLVVVFLAMYLVSTLGFPQTVQAVTEKWATLEPGPGGVSVLAVAVDPKTTSTLYAGTKNGIYKSTDSGANWVISNNGLLTYYGDVPTIHAISIHPLLTNTLYLGSGSGGVFKSINGGQSWTSANNGISNYDVQTVVIDPQNPAVLYVGTMGYSNEGGIFKSINNGESWIKVNQGLPTPAYVYSVLIDPNNTNILYAGLFGEGLYKSINGGETWTVLNAGEFIKYNRVLIMDLNTPTTLYLGTENMGIFKSVNGGETFIAFPLGTNSNQSVSTIWQADASTVYAGTETGGVYKSTDSGENWILSSFGLHSSYIQVLTGFGNNPSVIYAGTTGGVFKTLDGGATWTERFSGLPAAQTESLLLLPQEPHRLYAGTAGGGIYSYLDQNWVSMSSGISNTWIRGLAYDPTTPTTLYAGTLLGPLYKSTNGGSTWTDKSSGLPISRNDIREVVVHPTTSATLYAALGGGLPGTNGIYKSLDGGDHWVKASEGMPVVDSDALSLTIDPDNPEVLFAGVMGYGVYKTINGGQTWKPSSSGLTNLIIKELAIDPNQSSIVYAGAESRLFRSVDSGASWTPTDLDYTVTSIVFNTLAPDTLYAGTEGWGIYQSVNNGLTWEQITRMGYPDGNAYINDLDLDSNKQMLYAATEYGIRTFCLSWNCGDASSVNVFLPLIIR